jgi:hypothetical protein
VSGSGTFTNIGPAVFSGSLTSTEGFTGSFSGTATSASYAANAELLDGLDSSVFATTGSNTFAGIQTINSNLVVTGSITAQTLVVQTITSSVDFVTGSTRFGSILGNTHVFSGSVTMNPGGLFVSSSGTVGIGNVVPAYTLDVSGTGRFTSTLLVSGIGTFGSSAGSGLRVYGASGTNQWDIYLNSTNLRFSDNTGTGSIVFDRPISGTSATFSGALTSNSNITSTNGYIYGAYNAGDVILWGGIGAYANIYGALSWDIDKAIIKGRAGYGLGMYVDDNLSKGITLASTGAATFSSSVQATAMSIGVTPTANILVVRGENATNDGTIRFGVRGYLQHRDSGNTITSLANDYNSDSAKIEFRMKGNTTSDAKMTILGSGNVGINVSPDSNVKLAVTGVDATSSNFALYIRNSAATTFYVRNDGRMNTGLAAASPYNDTTANAANMNVDSAGFLNRSTASSLRFKENINDWNESGIETILALKPKTFTYKADYYKNPDVVMLGLIAEEVAEVSPYLAEYENEDRTGQIENVRYANIVVPLIKAIQEQQATITALQEKLERNNII